MEAIDHLKAILNTISTIHLDMGGRHRYALNHRSHDLIRNAKAWLGNRDNNILTLLTKPKK